MSVRVRLESSLKIIVIDRKIKTVGPKTRKFGDFRSIEVVTASARRVRRGAASSPVRVS